MLKLTEEPPKIDSWARYRIETKKQVQEKKNNASLLEDDSMSKSGLSTKAGTSTRRSAVRRTGSRFLNPSNVRMARSRVGSGNKSKSKSKDNVEAKERRYSYNSYKEEPGAIKKFLNAPIDVKNMRGKVR